MSYTLLGSGASWLAAHAMTARAADNEYHGHCDTDPDDGVLVLDDGGNQHALIVEGTDDELRAFAQRVTDAVAAITGAGAVTYKVGDADPTPDDDRIICAAAPPADPSAPNERVRDADGDVWDKGEDGLYRIAAWHDGGMDHAVLTLDVLRTSYGPLRDVSQGDFVCRWPLNHLHPQHVAGDGEVVTAVWPVRS